MGTKGEGMKCPVCNGSGRSSGRAPPSSRSLVEVCFRCKGSGKIAERPKTFLYSGHKFTFSPGSSRELGPDEKPVFDAGGIKIEVEKLK